MILVLDSLRDYAATKLGVKEPDLETEPLEAFEHGNYNTPDLDDYGLDESDLEPYMAVIDDEEALNVREEDVHSLYDGQRPVLLNEAVAVAASMEQYNDRITDQQKLGIELYDHIVNETGLADHLLDESDDSGSTHPSTVTGIYRDTVVPDIEGGNGGTASFTYDEENGWSLANGGETELGVELLRKQRSSLGGKSPRDNPHNMWRLREVELEDGEPTTTWKDNPTKTTDAVHDAATEVMDDVREVYPSAELTFFGSVEQGTMNQRSDLEHSVHLDVEDVDRMVDPAIEDTADVKEHYLDVYSAINWFREKVEQAVIEAAAERGHDVKRGYGYVAVRDDKLEYPLNREKRFSTDERVLVTDDTKHIEYNQYLAEQGLQEGHPPATDVIDDARDGL